MAQFSGLLFKKASEKNWCVIMTWNCIFSIRHYIIYTEQCKGNEIPSRFI
jgi:hypothetical protein